MSSFGTGSLTTDGVDAVITVFTGTNGAQAGTDGLVPGPAAVQQGYVLGAGGDWTLTVLGGIAVNDNSNRIATTSFVQGVVAAAALGGNAALSALNDVTFVGLAGGNFIRYDAVAEKWKNVDPSLSDLSDIDLTGLAVGNTLVWDGANFVPGAGGGGGGATTLDDLTDVTIAAPALNHFLVNNGAGQFVNRVISSADLSNSANIALLNANQTFTGAVNFTTLAVNNNTTRAATTAYVEAQIDNDITALNLGSAAQSDTGDFLANTANPFAEIATGGAVPILAAQQNLNLEVGVDVQAYSALLTTLAGLNIADGNFIVGNGVTFVVESGATARTSLGLGSAATSNTGDFLASNAGLNDLSDVTIAAPATKHFLVNNGAGQFVNRVISSADLSDGASLAPLNAPSFTGIPTAPTAGQGTNTTQLATTAFVQNEITALNLGGTYQPLSNSLTDIAALAPTADNFIVGDGNDFILKTPAQVATILGGSFQATDATLTSISALGTAADKYIYTTGVDTWAEGSITEAGRALLDDATAPDQRTTLGLAIGSDVQAYDPTLASISALGTATDKYIYTTGVDTWAEGSITAFGRSLLDDADVATARATLELEPGIDVQPFDLTLNAISALGTGANKIIYTTGVDTWAESDVSALGLSLLDDADVATAQATLGLTIGTNVQAYDATLSALAGVAVANNQIIYATGADSFSTTSLTANARTFLGTDAGIDNLSDVTLGALANNEALIYSGGVWQNSNRVAFRDIAQSISGDYTFTGAVALGENATATTQPDADDSTKVATTAYVKNIVAAVGGVASLDDLTDVAIGGVALATGQVLRYDAGSSEFKNLALSSSDLSDSASLVKTDTANTLTGNLTLYAGLAPAVAPDLEIKNDTNTTTFSVDGQTGNTSVGGTLSVTGSITCSDLTVNGTTTVVNTTNLQVSDSLIGLNTGIGAVANTRDLGLFLNRGTLNPALLFWDEGDDTFKVGTKAGATDSDTDLGGVGFTYASLRVASPLVASDSNEVATTEWVNDIVGALSTDSLTDVEIAGAGGVALASGQVLRYDAGSNLFRNSALGLTDLSDVTVGVASAGQVLRHNGAGEFVNATLAHTDLSDHASYAPLASPNLTGNPTAPTQVAGNNTTRIANTEFVTTAITNFGNSLGSAAQSDATDFLSVANNLSDLNNTGTARTNLGLGSAATKNAGTGAGEVLLLTDANKLPALDGTSLSALGSVTLHSDVEITPLALQAGQTLRYDGANFINTKLASSDLTDTANIVLLNANQTLTGSTRATTQVADDNSTLLATTAFVQQEILNASISDLSNVEIGGVAVGDMLRWNGANFVNVQPVVAHITDAGTAATKTAGTGAGNVLLLAEANKLPALDGTNLSGVVMEANNLSDLTDPATARTNLGLGSISTRNSNEFLSVANNLSDLGNTGTARTNLGLTSTATTPLANLLQAANNLSDLANTATARTNLGLTSTATTLLTAILQVANSLSEIAAAGALAQATARTNLGLGSAATSSTGDFLASNASINSLSDVDTAGVAVGNTLVWDGTNFVPGAGGAGGGITVEEARDAAGTALQSGVHSGATTISFTNEDANDRINLTLAIETANLTDISADEPTHGQVLKYTTVADLNKYVPTSLGSATDYDVGTLSGEIPLLGSPSLTSSNALAELVVLGRIVETIDYGSVTQTIVANGGWALDFNGSGLADTVVYANEDYGVLVG
jgi:hypothetical protein